MKYKALITPEVLCDRSRDSFVSAWSFLGVGAWDFYQFPFMLPRITSQDDGIEPATYDARKINRKRLQSMLYLSAAFSFCVFRSFTITCEHNEFRYIRNPCW